MSVKGRFKLLLFVLTESLMPRFFSQFETFWRGTFTLSRQPRSLQNFKLQSMIVDRLLQTLHLKKQWFYWIQCCLSLNRKLQKLTFQIAQSVAQLLDKLIAFFLLWLFNFVLVHLNLLV
jgi:hypothetical protein